jgi:hypothetical protein
MLKKFSKKNGNLIGLNFYKFYSFIRNLPRFWKDYQRLKAQAEKSNLEFPFVSFYPCLFDKNKSGGVVSGHYFHQDLWAASKIYHMNPARHIDVGSRVDGFVAHVASYRKIEVADIRNLDSNVENIDFFQLDILDDLPKKYHGCTDSLSCLHVLEHCGLGRYGDDLQWDGYITAFKNLTKMLKSRGVFYFSTPIGPQRIEFNAHRVFDVRTLLDLFSDNYIVQEFSFVDDLGDLNEQVPFEEEKINNNYSCKYGCGIFQLQKK